MREYHEAILYLSGLDHSATKMVPSAELAEQTKNEINSLLAACYNNLAGMIIYDYNTILNSVVFILKENSITESFFFKFNYITNFSPSIDENKLTMPHHG